ncbi:MAG: helix-turn-helix transcriptional regulator [Pseudomonadota bacterium]
MADALGQTRIVLATARGTGDEALVRNEAAYVDPDRLALVQEHYATPETNPALEAMPRIVPDRIDHFTRYTPWEAILGTSFYADYWKPSGVWHAAGYLTRFTQRWELFFAFGLRHDRDWFTGEEARLAAEGARTLARAVRLRTELDDARAIASLDAEPGRLILVVDRMGTVMHGPGGAAATLAGLDLVQGPVGTALRLAPRDPVARRQLDTALHAVAVSAPNGGGRFVLVGSASSERAIVEVRSGPRYRQRPSALVRIDRIGAPHQGPSWTAALLGAAYGFTPREAEVVLGLCAGRGTERIADDLGLAVGSVRLYLKRAMAKAGVHSQAQLVAEILGKVSR